MNLLEVKRDQTNVTIKLKPAGGEYIQLVYVKKIYGFAVFKAARWRSFWRVWHGSKRRLKENNVEVVKNDNDRWEIHLPIGWYELQLTASARAKLDKGAI